MINKKEIRQLKSIQSSNTCSKILNEISVKNMTERKESNISSTKNKFSPKNKTSSTNHILNSIGDETKSKSSLNIKIKKKDKEKSDLSKNKKKSRDKIAKFLQIPRGKRRSIAVNRTKINLNNINNMLKTLTPPKEIKVRTDKNGIEINKNNKKKVHITFRDDISPNHKITDTVNIQSFKEFNIFEKSSSENNLSNCNKCCIIF